MFQVLLQYCSGLQFLHARPHINKMCSVHPPSWVSCFLYFLHFMVSEAGWSTWNWLKHSYWVSRWTKPRPSGDGRCHGSREKWSQQKGWENSSRHVAPLMCLEKNAWKFTPILAWENESDRNKIALVEKKFMAHCVPLTSRHLTANNKRARQSMSFVALWKHWLRIVILVTRKNLG